jgi:hypothetical protein
MNITVRRQVHFKAAAKGQKKVKRGQKPEMPTARVPRIARLMALAIHFDELLRERKVKDLAELARLGQVSRARVTQVMNLLNLAPAIQEELLFTEVVVAGRDVRTERKMRVPAAEYDWIRQAMAAET